MSINFLLDILKSVYVKIKSSAYKNRYYKGVDFRNPQNIDIKSTSIIEKGARIWVTDPVDKKINVCIEDNCWIGRDVEIQTYYGSDITLKNKVSVQDRCKILGDVYIGQYTLLAPDVFLSSGNHFFDFKPSLLIKQQDKLMVGDAEGFRQHSKPVIIGEDCWIGKNVMVQKDVNIGRGVIVAANSFVKNNIPPYEIWGGTPARFLKKRLDFVPPNELDFKVEDHIPYFYMGFDHTDISDGFLSNNLSVCVLKSDPQNTQMSFHAKIIKNGDLKIWINNSLIFDKKLSRGVIKQDINIAEPGDNTDNGHNLYKLISNELKIHHVIIFEFFSEFNKELPGFSIYKITNNEKKS